MLLWFIVVLKIVFVKFSRTDFPCFCGKTKLTHAYEKKKNNYGVRIINGQWNPLVMQTRRDDEEWVFENDNLF